MIVKKIILYVISFVLLHTSVVYSFKPVRQQFGPQSHLLPIDQIEFARPKDMVNILPGRPVAARDKYGNRTYFSPTGRAVLRISNDGKREFSLGAYSKETDEKGNLLRETTKSQGSKFVEVKNDKGEIVGYQELGLGGRIVREYDANMNLTKSYHYNDYGKKIEYVVDELTQGRTVYDEKGRPVYDLDFEGNVMAVYEYDEDSRLEVKIDVHGNKTYFDKKGNMTATYDYRGNLLVKYEYGITREGHIQLVRTKDMLTNNVTHFKNGRQVNVTNAQGAVIRDYIWDGNKLIATYDRETQETTWYGINGKPLYTTYNDIKIKEWLYYEGRLVGFYDSRNKSLVIYQYEREDYIINGVEESPNAKTIQNLYDTGVIAKLRKGIRITKETTPYKTLPKTSSNKAVEPTLSPSPNIPITEPFPLGPVVSEPVGPTITPQPGEPVIPRLGSAELPIVQPETDDNRPLPTESVITPDPGKATIPRFRPIELPVITPKPSSEETPHFEE